MKRRSAQRGGRSRFKVAILLVFTAGSALLCAAPNVSEPEAGPEPSGELVGRTAEGIVSLKPPPIPPELYTLVPPPVPSAREDVERYQRQMQQLERFLSLSSEELAQMRQTLERLEALTPEQRAALRERARILSERGDVRFKEASFLALILPDEAQNSFIQFWMSLSEAEHAAHHTALRERPANERAAYLHEETQRFAERLAALGRTLGEAGPDHSAPTQP